MQLVPSVESRCWQRTIVYYLLRPLIDEINVGSADMMCTRSIYTPPGAYPTILYEPAFPYGEALLQFIWERGLLGGHTLVTTDGDPVEVLHAGRIQYNGGPDLDGARVRIGQRVWAGCIEVHVHAAAWYHHAHHTDPAYDNVVLHVVYQGDAPIRTVSGRTVPTLALAEHLPEATLRRYAALLGASRPVPCTGMLMQRPEAMEQAWLKTVLNERLQRKTSELSVEHAAAGLDDATTCYHVLAAAFGMPVNTDAFRGLAQAVPLRLLRKYIDDRERVHALYFGQAGLLHTSLNDPWARQLTAEYTHLRKLHGLEPMQPSQWRFARMRPAAFPTLRIAQFAELMRTLPEGPTGLLSITDLPALRARLNVGAGPEWQERYLFDRPAEAVTKNFGAAAVDRVLINAVVPLLVHFARLRWRPDMHERALELLTALPAEKNVRLQAWAQAGIRPADAGQGQALLELMGRYCSEKACLRCGVGKRLLLGEGLRKPSSLT